MTLMADAMHDGEQRRRRAQPRSIELPAPTPWPMVAALGITLGFAGLVTHCWSRVVGVVLIVAGAVGWFREVLPVEHDERVPLRPPAQRARPVAAGAAHASRT